MKKVSQKKEIHVTTGDVFNTSNHEVWVKQVHLSLSAPKVRECKADQKQEILFQEEKHQQDQVEGTIMHKNRVISNLCISNHSISNHSISFVW